MPRQGEGLLVPNGVEFSGVAYADPALAVSQVRVALGRFGFLGLLGLIGRARLRPAKVGADARPVLFGFEKMTLGCDPAAWHLVVVDDSGVVRKDVPNTVLHRVSSSGLFGSATSSLI